MPSFPKGFEPLTDTDIQDIASGFRPARILLSAFELGVFTALGAGPRASADVAIDLGLDPRITDRLMNALTAIGLMRKHGELFKNTPAALKYLVKGSDSYMAALGHTSETYHSWGTLTEAVRKGTRVHAKTPMEDPAWTVDFIAAMHWRAQGQAGELVAALDLSGVFRLLDVGGGSGAFAMAFCRAKEDLSAVVFDLPSVTPLTEGYVAGAGLSERVTAVTGDYRKDELGQNFDMVLFSAIMHINSPAMNQDLLTRAARALNPGGRMVISDFFIDPGRTSPLGSALFAVNMIVNTDQGDTYTVDEMTAWLKTAGCVNTAYIGQGPGKGLLVGQIP